MKKCILCNKPLYETISFETLFKVNYFIHKKCLSLLNEEEYITFPFMDLTVSIHVLFPSNFQVVNKPNLFAKYGYHFFHKVTEFDDRNILYIIDELLSDTDFVLLAKLCHQTLVLLTYTKEDFLQVKDA